MIRLFKRESHRFVRTHIHKTWMVWTIRIWTGVSTFFHSLLVFLGFLFLVVSTMSNVVHVGAHYLTVSNKWDYIQALKLQRLTWDDMVLLAAIPALVTALWSIYSAYSRWHHWAHHGHTWDKDLSANGHAPGQHALVAPQ